MKVLHTLMLFLLLGCSEPTPEAKWLATQQARCDAMGATSSYTNGTLECFRHPIGRMTKKLFETRFP